MTRVLDRRRVIDLRKQGKTYSEIRKLLPVAKSTLSDWLSKYPLTEIQLKKLEKRKRANKLVGIEKTISAKKKKRAARLQTTYKNERKRLLPLSVRELYIAGLFLYWGEGNKRLLGGQVSLNNTDPLVIKFYLSWLKKALHIPTEKIKVFVHLYKDMDVNDSLQYWSKELELPIRQFRKPYIKKSKRTDIDHKGFGHGTCALVVNNTALKEKILMGISAIADYYAHKL